MSITIVICPGVHDPNLTESFIAQLQAAKPFIASQKQRSSPTDSQKLLIFPAQTSPAYSAVHMLEFLQKHCSRQSSLVLICFSAGVVGGAGAAWAWQQLGGKIRALLAFDGWGVPLYNSFPIHRFSHDYFTHWSSSFLGAGNDSFYADPSIEHLELWRSPHTVQGWWVRPNQNQRTTAATLINLLLARYANSG